MKSILTYANMSNTTLIEFQVSVGDELSFILRVDAETLYTYS